jgi:Brp/Blh family beta-carotene 15,15'-monooxygenase
MSNTQKISILLTILVLFVSFFFNTRTDTITAFALILTVGILHGANDIQIIRKVKSEQIPFFGVLGSYIAIVLAVGFVFFILPQLALIMFILMSAYHFGEQHFHRLNLGTAYRYLFFTAYGLTILFMLLSAHAELSASVIIEITGIVIPEHYFSVVLIFSSTITFLIGLLLTIKGRLKHWYKELLFLAAFYFVFQESSLIMGFALYFVLWHALPSLFDQIQFLSGVMNKASLWSYIKSSLLYWSMSLLGLFLFVFFLRENNQLFLTLFFTFLAAITFPHVLVMHYLFKDFDKKL